MEEANVERTLVRVFKNYADRNTDSISRTTYLREDLGLSSFDMIALSAEIEDEFSINMDNIDVLAEIDTFGDVVDLVAGMLADG